LRIKAFIHKKGAGKNGTGVTDKTGTGKSGIQVSVHPTTIKEYDLKTQNICFN
jgi:hypothetical protein